MLTVGGLTNGTAYVFRVAAVTPAGVGEFSPKSQPLTPYALPSKPTITGLAPQDGALSVTFDPPATGAPPTGYQYRVDGGSWVPVAGTGQPIVIPGLTNGVAVDIELRATSAMGTGAISDPASGTPRAVPSATPRVIVTATPAPAETQPATSAATPVPPPAASPESNTRWYSMTLGALAAGALIGLGALLNLLQWIGRRREP